MFGFSTFWWSHEHIVFAWGPLRFATVNTDHSYVGCWGFTTVSLSLPGGHVLEWNAPQMYDSTLN